jgi:Transposase
LYSRGHGATGVYWKPVWHILEGRFQQILANVAHIKAVPGRKSDTNDATWIADLLAHGLIRARFVSPQPIQERDLTRTRKQLTREIVQHTQRIQAVLEEANIKVSSVITDILGMSGRRILKAIVSGETDPMRLGRARRPTARRNEVGTCRCPAWPGTPISSLPDRAALEDHRAAGRDDHGLRWQIEAALEPFRATLRRSTCGSKPGVARRKPSSRSQHPS